MTVSSECIRLTELAFRWNRDTSNIIQIPTLAIAKGETLFIHGASGSGKTTLLNLITGVLLPQKGNIEILGNQLTQQKQTARDRFRVDHFGIIFQQFNLIPYLNVYENITLPCSFSERRKTRIEVDRNTIAEESNRLLQALGLKDVGISQRNVTELSTGQQQRVAAARALIGSPEIIIADEPTSALDADAKQGFLKLLFEEVRNTNSALIFVSHDRSLASAFDRVESFEEINKDTIV